MELTSSAFENGGAIPRKYTCQGNQVSPPLQITGLPEGTVSLVLLVDDPDAVPVAGKVWDHWVVWNIPPTTTIGEGQVPGTQGTSTGGTLGYEGPCPPDRQHTYSFRVYALDAELSLDEGSAKSQVERATDGHVLGHAELTGTYEKT